MTQTRQFRCNRAAWFGAIAGVLLAIYPNIAKAQIAGDDTLGTQVNGSAIAPCAGDCIITNGTTRGSNLFHSFRQFSLPNGDFAGFVITPAIQNVIVRVTGVGQPLISNINGTIASSNPVNFFLLNPNGIIFGPNASLLIGGSFLATTADRMLFQDGTFSTIDSAPLLSVNVPIGVQFGSPPGNIQARGSRLLVGQNSSFGDFALVGGDVSIDDSVISTSVTPGQRVELGAVGKDATVGVQLTVGRLSLSFAAGIPRQDISLTNGSIVDSSATTHGGAVVVTGRNIVLDGSGMLTGILPGINNTATNRAGDITIDATATLRLTRGSIIYNLVNQTSIGQGGNINITANSLDIAGSSRLAAVSLGQGNAGKIVIQAQDIVSFTGDSNIFNTTESGAVGNTGGVTIHVPTLILTEGSQIQASISGQGNGGGVTIQTQDRTTIDGVGFRRLASGIFSQVQPEALGNGGNIVITTGSLALTNGGLLTTTTRGQGSSGDVRVQASGEVLIDGIGAVDASQISTTVGTGGIGSGGNIEITAQSLFITNGGDVNASTFGQGKGGDIVVQVSDQVVMDGVNTTQVDNPYISGLGSEVGFDGSAGIGNGGNVSITTRSLTITNGANLSTSTLAQGNAGNVTITASGPIVMGGIGSDGSLSLLTSGVNSSGVGNGGDINVSSESMVLRDGAQIGSATFGRGNAGDINLQAIDSITFDGASAEGFSSGIFTTVNPGGVGQGGNIDVTTPSLTITNGAALVTSTSGKGNSGDITIRARDQITFDGVAFDNIGTVLPSRAFSRVSPGAIGNGGQISIIAGSLNLANSAQLSASTAGTGNAGNISVEANRFTATSSGQLRTTTFSSGEAGNILVNVANNLTLTGRDTGLFAGAEAGSTGKGGSVTLQTRLLSLSNNAQITGSTAGQGNAGSINVTANGCDQILMW